MYFLRGGIKIPHTIINIPSDGVFLGVCIHVYVRVHIYIFFFAHFLLTFILRPSLSFPAVGILLSPLYLPPFASYASLHHVLLMMVDNAWDIISKVVLRIIVLTIGMKTEWKYPTSKNISQRDRRRGRRMRVRSEKIRRRRTEKRGRMRGKRGKGRGK
jgi:hypothetical protein